MLVGDHRQLPELEAGGAFRGLVQRGLAIELTENLRQVHAWERARSISSATAAPRRRSRSTTRTTASPSTTRRSARAQRLVDDWWAAGDPSRAVMIAQRRADVADLNARAREHMRAAGALGGRELRLPGGAFAVGDRVVVKRNDLRLGVDNGDRGRVIARRPRRAPAHARLSAASGSRSTPSFLDDRTAHGEPTLLHGYAITGHVAQGLTVDRAFVLAGDGINREWATSRSAAAARPTTSTPPATPTRARAEFAPTDPHRTIRSRASPPSSQTSTANTLAIDAGTRRRRTGSTASRGTACTAEAVRPAPRRGGLARRWLPAGRPEIEAARLTERLAEQRERLARELPRPPVKPTRRVEPPVRRQERDRGRDFGIEL